MKELCNCECKYNIITYDLFLHEIDELILKNLKNEEIELVISKSPIYYYYSGTDLYNEVLYVSGKLREINDFFQVRSYIKQYQKLYILY